MDYQHHQHMEYKKTKLNLLKVAKQLLNITEKELTSDIDLEGNFDHIDSSIFGLAGLKPRDMFKLKNLNWFRDNHGQSYFSSFLELVIQSSIKIGFDSAAKQYDKMIESYKEQLRLRKIQLKEYNDLVEMLRSKQIPEGHDLKEEVAMLRKENKKLKIQNVNLHKYKNEVNKLAEWSKREAEADKDFEENYNENF